MISYPLKFNIYRYPKKRVIVFDGLERQSKWWFQRLIILTPIPGEMVQFDFSHTFQMGWFNHQLADTSSKAHIFLLVSLRRVYNWQVAGTDFLLVLFFFPRNLQGGVYCWHTFWWVEPLPGRFSGGKWKFQKTKKRFNIGWAMRNKKKRFLLKFEHLTHFECI